MAEFDVHHCDGDHYNNAPDNLAAVHHGCHSTFHAHDSERAPLTEAHRANISAALKGKPKTPEHRAAIKRAKAGFIPHAAIEAAAIAKRGKPIPAESRAKMAAAQRARRERERTNA